MTAMHAILTVQSSVNIYLLFSSERSADRRAGEFVLLVFREFRGYDLYQRCMWNYRPLFNVEHSILRVCESATTI
jgi:hypothetical protein